MSLARCIPDLLRDGTITPEQAKKAEGMFRELSSELRRSMAPDAADATASARTVEALEFEAARKRLNALRQVNAQRNAEAWIRGGGENWGGGGRVTPPDAPPPGGGPSGPISPKAARTLISRVDARRRAIEARAFAHMDGILADHHANVLGQLRNPAEMDDLGRAAFGEKVDSLAAREMADAWDQTGDLLRTRANAAGASIGKLERRGFAQHHDSRAVAEAGFEAWNAAETSRLDWNRIVDSETGQPFTAAGRQQFMRSVFATITSDGASKRTPGAPGKLSFANRLGQHRELHYKSYDHWKASQAQFGSGTAFDAMMGEVKGMSRAVAAMEILGPNPEATIRYLRDIITGDKTLFETGQLRTRDKALGQAVALQRVWDEYTGALRQPENRQIAAAFSAYRSVAAASKLGGAVLTATGDVGFGMATRRFNGLPQARALGGYLKMLNPTSQSDRRLAARLGFVAETWISTVSGQNRFLAEELTGQVSRRVADGVLRASGLNAWTDAGRMTFGLEMLSHITRESRKNWENLDAPFRSMLTRYGIGEPEWRVIRETPTEEDGGVKWIKPQNVPDQTIGDRILEMMHNESDFAVPVPDLETRAYMNANARKGTFLGESIRSSPLMFKTFTVSMMIRHGGRMMAQPGIGGKAGYFLSLVIPVTLMGALAVQLKEIAKGRDPRPMEDPAFWGHAMVMGGGSGIVGDLLGLTAENRFGGWDQYAAGPLIGDVSRLAGSVGGLGRNALYDAGFDVKEQPRAAWNLSRVIRDNLPGQNMWYTRLAIDRLLADQIQSHIDPEYARSWRQTEHRARQQGQEFWWAQGELGPDHAPDLSNMVLSGAPQ